MKFSCYADWNQLPGSADALFEQASKGSLFYSRAWLANLSGVLEKGEHLLLACVEDDGKLLALLPLIKAGGNNYYSLKHRYTTHFSLLLADTHQQQVLTCLVQGLTNLPVASLLLEPVADDDSRLNNFQAQLEAAGYHCERLFRFYNWVYHVEGRSFDDYMSERPTRLRNTIARKKRKLEREHGYNIRLFTGKAVPAAMHDYYAVYTSSWKANEQYKGFLDEVVAAFSRQGWSRLAVLYAAGQPVAAQLWFVLHGKAVIFRLAYNEAWKPYSPGSILTSYLMKYVIDTDMVEEIDFLTGNDTYKQDWMSTRRQRFALSCVKNVQPAGRFARFVDLLRRMFTIG